MFARRYRWCFLEMCQSTSLESQGIDREQAQVLRTSLATFSEDWDSPKMSIYDNYDAAKANG